MDHDWGSARCWNDDSTCAFTLRFYAALYATPRLFVMGYNPLLVLIMSFEFAGSVKSIGNIKALLSVDTLADSVA